MTWHCKTWHDMTWHEILHGVVTAQNATFDLLATCQLSIFCGKFKNIHPGLVWDLGSIDSYSTRRFFGGLVLGSASVVQLDSPTDSASQIPLSVSHGHEFTVWLSLARSADSTSVSRSALKTLWWSDDTPRSITAVTLGNAMSHLHMCASSSRLAAPQETRSLMWAGMTSKRVQQRICIYVYIYIYTMIIFTQYIYIHIHIYIYLLNDILPYMVLNKHISLSKPYCVPSLYTHM